jgi:hypothetical protein
MWGVVRVLLLWKRVPSSWFRGSSNWDRPSCSRPSCSWLQHHKVGARQMGRTEQSQCRVGFAQGYMNHVDCSELGMWAQVHLRVSCCPAPNHPHAPARFLEGRQHGASLPIATCSL